jgi:hypothetical protein
MKALANAAVYRRQDSFYPDQGRSLFVSAPADDVAGFALDGSADASRASLRSSIEYQHCSSGRFGHFVR